MKEIHRSPSYQPCDGCSCNCNYEFSSTPEQPCWGRVLALDEVGGDEGGYIHGCEGHEDIGIGGTYREEPKKRD